MYRILFDIFVLYSTGLIPSKAVKITPSLSESNQSIFISDRFPYKRCLVKHDEMIVLDMLENIDLDNYIYWILLEVSLKKS